jgi:protein AATF/BFR2
MKSQLKRDTYRVLGSTDAEEALKMSDLNLFNDHDYYQLLLNDFLSMNDKQGETTETKEGAEFLYGADLSLTQKYLMKRQKLKELQIQKKKEIDRKATKGRKLKFVVHDKLLNFMAP